MATLMVLSPTRLRRELKRAGIANAAIDAVWPQWWSDEAADSLSATAELTYTVARRLGLSPRSLLDGTTEFIWRDETKFKNLAAGTSQEAAALASFGIAVGQCAIEATDAASGTTRQVSAHALRDAILAQQPIVDHQGLLAYCWSAGIPVLQLRVFPLRNKRMHALTARVGGRYAVLLAKEATYLAPTTYILAHEVGHVVLGHLESDNALMEMADPVREHEGDAEEVEADRFALALLTGSEEPAVGTNTAELWLQRGRTSRGAHRCLQPSERGLAWPGFRAGPRRKRWGAGPDAVSVVMRHQRGVISGTWAMNVVAAFFIAVVRLLATRCSRGALPDACPGESAREHFGALALSDVY